MAEYRKYAEPHPHWINFPNNLPPGTEIHRISRDENPIVPQKGLEINEIDIVEAGDGCKIPVRSYRRPTAQQAIPILIYMHGGGFVSGSLDTDDNLCRAIAAHEDILVLNVAYRLAPEHKFPVGFEDCLSVVRWVASEKGKSYLNCDLEKSFLLGGTSAGGNFTSAIAHVLAEEKLFPPLTGLVFLASSFCHPDVRPVEFRDRILSVDEIDDAPGLTAKSIRYFAEKYEAPPADKRYSPLLFESRKSLARKAFFQICGWDPRRDEAILYGELLESAGLQVTTKIYSGLPHGFWHSCPSLEESKAAQQDLLSGISWLLH